MENDLETMAPGQDGVSVHTGFPNPALDRRGQARLSLDLNQLLINQPSSTFLFRIRGHSWVDQGVFDGDVAVVDRSLKPRATDLVIGRELSGFCLWRGEQPNRQGLSIWGVVTAVIHRFERA